MKKLVSALCVLLGVCLIFSSFSVSAATKIDLDRGITMSVKYEYNGTPVSDVRFNVYKVADLRSDGTFTATPDFANYSVSYYNLNSEKLKSLSDTLSAYIMRDKIEPLASSVTDSDGIAAFGFKEKQTAGLYLISGEKKQVGNSIYTPETLMISMPAASESGENDIYDVVAVPKIEVENKNKRTNIEVNKVWKNDSSQSRPKSVTVQLMRDSEVYSEIKLSKNNGWRYEWTDLDVKHTWTIAEKNVSGNYTVLVTHSGKNYIISNTYNDTETTRPSDTTNVTETTRPSDTTDATGTTNPNETTRPGDTTKPNDTTRPGDTTNPNDTTRPGDTTNPNDTTRPGDTTKPNGTTRPGSTTKPNESTKPSVPETTKPPEKIPQTGMLEWPIPLMFECGAAFVIIGTVFCIRKKNEDEE